MNDGINHTASSGLGRWTDTHSPRSHGHPRITERHDSELLYGRIPIMRENRQCPPELLEAAALGEGHRGLLGYR